MSIERMARRALWRLVIFRLVNDCFGLVRRLLFAVAACALDIERALMYLELDAARRYYAITGVDLGFAGGEASRYHGIRPEVADRYHASLEPGGEDEEE